MICCALHTTAASCSYSCEITNFQN